MRLHSYWHLSAAVALLMACRTQAKAAFAHFMVSSSKVQC